MKKVCCIGIVTSDIIVKPADAVPPPGQLQAVESISMHVGGCAANASVDMQILGVPSCLITKVGNDSFGDFVLKYLMEKGLDTSGVVVDKNVTTTASVACIYSNGERSFLYNPSSNDSIVIEDINMDLVNSSDIVFIAGSLLMNKFDGPQCAAFLEKCKALGKYTVMDTAWDFRDIWMKKIKSSLPLLDLFMPSYDEAVKLSGETEPEKQADIFVQHGVKNVVIKLGKDGAYVCEEGGCRYFVPTYKHIKPVDTTGAGDSFCAGFLAGLSKGWSYKECTILANAVGTHCVMEIGASTGIKPLPEILRFINENPL